MKPNAEWISIKENLPEQGAQVLGYDEFYYAIDTAYYTGRTDDHGEPRLVFNHTDDCHITHWMPLPDPPEGPARE